MRISRDNALKLMEWRGFNTADTWNKPKLEKKINELPDYVKDDEAIGDKELDDLLDEIIAHVDEKGTVEVYLVKEAKSEEKTKSKPKPKPKQTRRRKQKPPVVEEDPDLEFEDEDPDLEFEDDPDLEFEDDPDLEFEDEPVEVDAEPEPLKSKSRRGRPKKKVKIHDAPTDDDEPKFSDKQLGKTIWEEAVDKGGNPSPAELIKLANLKVQPQTVKRWIYDWKKTADVDVDVKEAAPPKRRRGRPKKETVKEEKATDTRTKRVSESKSKVVHKITRRLEFDAGHRIMGHESKCKYLHGHRYVAEITVEAPELDDLGRVVDFSVIKKVVGAWIDEHWDHNFIVCEVDPILCQGETIRKLLLSIQGRSLYVLQGNPTAENMVQELFNVATKLLRASSDSLSVTHVRLYETPNCWADCYGSNQ